MRVLLAPIEAPGVPCPKNFVETCSQHREKFAADIPLTFGHHGVENSGPFRLGDSFLPWVPLSCEAQGNIVHGQVNIFREPIYRVEDFRQRCAALKEKPTRKTLNREELFQNPTHPEVFFNDGFRQALPSCRFSENISAFLRKI